MLVHSVKYCSYCRLGLGLINCTNLIGPPGGKRKCVDYPYEYLRKHLIAKCQEEELTGATVYSNVTGGDLTAPEVEGEGDVYAMIPSQLAQGKFESEKDSRLTTRVS